MTSGHHTAATAGVVARLADVCRLPLLQAMSVLWIVTLAMHILLSLANPDSPARAPLPWGLKLNLLAGETVLIAGLCLVPAIAAVLLRPARTVVLRTVLFLLFAIIAAFQVLSWGQALFTGYFAGVPSLRMGFTNPLALVLHSLHFHRAATLAAPFLIVGAAAGLTWLTELSVTRRWSCSWVLVAIALSGVVFAARQSVPWHMVPFDLPTSYPHPRTGQVATLGDYLNELYLRKTGPLTTLLGEMLVQRDEDLQFDPSLKVEWKPQLSLESYHAAATLPPERRHNVILVLVESLRPDELRVFGSAHDVMPNVDRIATEALVFTNHYTTASHSNYADLGPLSSHYPLRSHETHVYPRNPTYPRVLIYDLLKPLGYRTAIVSSQNENWGQMINYLTTPGLDALLHSENFEGTTYMPQADVGFVSMSKKSGKVDDRFTVDRALDWLDQGEGDPFFIYLNLQNSHFPFEIGPGFHRRFGPDHLDFEPLFGRLSPEQVEPMRGRYRDSLAYVDEQIGRLVAGLEERGEWENTLLIISGDTGQAFMEHGFSGHANKLYDEVLRTPLIVRIPDHDPAVRTDLAHHLDVPPTVLDALGLPPHPSFQGRSLLAPPTPREVYLVVQSPFAEQYSIVRDGWKLIHDPRASRPFLYHLEADPGEQVDLSAQEPELTAQLRRRLDTWRWLQIDYYHDLDRHILMYPPVLQY